MLAGLFLSLLLLPLTCTRAAAEGLESGSLSEKYRFAKMLESEDKYWLHWSFDTDAGTIAFAVNVSTMGWVGFGLSPNGQMPGSDVVIGWVDSEGNSSFHDRYATSRSEPQIDERQDWVLTGSNESQGRTVLEFKRNMVTCDEADIDITSATSRVIWSWSEDDPADITGLGKHTNTGSRNINLLGGLNEDVPNSSQEDSFFEIRNEDVVIPSTEDTTYWCKLMLLPEHIRDREHFVRRVSPVITPHNYQYVHHMVIFLCPSHQHVPALPQGGKFSSTCSPGTPYIQVCTNTRALGSWAVGGEDFVFPEGVGFPIGGNGNDHYLVLETHYDNPNLAADVMDSSGMRFYYTETPPTHRAGIMTVGHDISRIMIIPPTSSVTPRGYVTSGICTSECTDRYLPEEGITVFANIFHTHLIGRALKLRHYTRSDDDKCNGWKELAPIDENENYDFNFQQINILQRNVTVMKGDFLELECVYKSDREDVTLGGDSTKQEMCLSFVAYYPSTPLSICVSRPSIPSLQKFTDEYIPAKLQDEVVNNLVKRNTDGLIQDFGTVEWTANTVKDLECHARSGHVDRLCVRDTVQDWVLENLPGGIPEVIPRVQCPYSSPPEQCSSPPTQYSSLPTWCSSSGSVISTNTSLLLASLLLSQLLAILHEFSL